jgi:arginyl-tRNA synthetase
MFALTVEGIEQAVQKLVVNTNTVSIRCASRKCFEKIKESSMSSHPIHLYNSMTQKKEEFIPLKENQVTMYVCGVTVYDHAHIGHARAAIIFDVIYRYLKYRGFKVTYVALLMLTTKSSTRPTRRVSWKKSRKPIFTIHC